MLKELKEIFRSVTSGDAAVLKFDVEGTTYLRNFRPPERLILLGCGHIAQPVCRYASDLGFRVTVVDDRPAFADRSRFPDAEEILCDSFPSAIRRLQITEQDYIAVITRGHRFDAVCLREILAGTFPGYLGLLGSRRRVHLLMQQLEDEGFSREAMLRIHTPIGVEINALTVKEIAVSIAAQLIQCRNSDIKRRSGETRLADDHIDLSLLEYLACDEEPKALLIVYKTSGSTPVKSGAMMAVDRMNRTVGTIGGGCTENEALIKARRMIGTGQRRWIEVDLCNEDAEEEGMVCGGKMEVLIEDLAR